MPADTLVPVTIQLPAAVLDELTAAVAAKSGPSIFPNRRSRSAAVKSAVEAFVLNSRATASPAPTAAPPPRRFTTATVQRRASAG